MTPIGHMATGVAAGGIIAPVINKAFKTPYRALIPIYLVASVIPDVDGLSLLVSRAAYFGKAWYSHHMAGHSIIGAAVYATVLALFYLLFAVTGRGVINLFRMDKVPLEHRLRRTVGAWIAAFIGCLAHYAGDLPTPPGPWGGIALMWPSMTMYGGWNRIFWHNWYLIYLSIGFLGSYLAVQLVAGFFAAFTPRVMRWTGYLFRTAAVVLCALFLYQTAAFVHTHDLRTMGPARWDALNRSLVPAKYMKRADAYYDKATVFWRRSVITMPDIVKYGNITLHFFENLHRRVAPAVGRFMPVTRTREDDMALYRALQAMAPGMEDNRPGDYRVWILRDALPRPDYFNRGFLYQLIHRTKKHIMQMTNAWMVVIHIEERDGAGNAVRVKKIYHNDKIFVSDRIMPQLNLHELPQVTFKFWEHDRVQYSLIPGSDLTRFHNLAKGYYLTISTVRGHLWPNWRSGVLIHDGPWTEGCIIHAYLHTDIGRHLEWAYYPLWERADEIIKKDIRGTVYRGRNIYWGRLLFIKDPVRLETLAQRAPVTPQVAHSQ